MSPDKLLEKLARIVGESSSSFALADDPRWHRLTAGELSAETEAELRAWAATSKDARIAYEAFRPLSPEFRALIVSALKLRLLGELSETEMPQLLEALMSTIQAQASRVVLLSAKHRNVRVEVEDLVQDISSHLFENDGKVLRSWDPSQGTSLDSFVGRVAKRQAILILRTAKVPPLEDGLPFDKNFDREAGTGDPESMARSRDLLERILDRLGEKLSPMGWHLFDLLFLEKLSVAEVMDRENMTRSAVVQWRSRLRKIIRRLEMDPSRRSQDV